MSKKSQKMMVEVRGEDRVWHPCWIGYSAGFRLGINTDERERTKLGLKERKARATVAELIRPVTGYEELGHDRHDRLCATIRGFGLDRNNVRIVPFRKGTWTKGEG